MAGFEDRGRGPRAKECRRSLEAGKGKERDRPLEPPERDAAVPTHWFSLVRPMLDI